MIPRIIILIILFLIVWQWIRIVHANAYTVAERTIAYEAANQPFEGQVLVGRVIANRMRERGQTEEEVCYAYKQFSSYNKTKTPRKLTPMELENARNAWVLANKACSSPVNIYCRTDVAEKTYWTHDPKVVLICCVGEHSFYQERR